VGIMLAHAAANVTGLAGRCGNDNSRSEILLPHAGCHSGIEPLPSLSLHHL